MAAEYAVLQRIELERVERLATASRRAPCHAVETLSPRIERLGQLREARAAAQQAHPQVEILGPPELAPSLHVLERGAPQHGAAVGERAVDQHLASHRLVGEQRVVP